MPVRKHHINELKKIYLNQYGVQLSDKEAEEMANRLVNLFRILLYKKRDISPPRNYTK